MEHEDTEYKEGDGNDFIKFLFSCKPKEKNSIKLELSDKPDHIRIGLHIFQELLMIFTEGIDYLFFKENDKNISNLNEDNIILMNQYFNSFGFIIHIEIFTIKDYLDNMKMPNYFLNQELIKDNTPLPDLYYEIRVDINCEPHIYRISFDFLR
jgi:hypothetical protein